jgi:hypothetical protein
MTTRLPMSWTEPHAPLLRQPPSGISLFKIMKGENLIASMEGNYLHFTRVDCYTDLTTADKHDGEQLLLDRDGNATVRFENAPDFSFSDNCHRSRARTYAFCASVENSQFIWDNYGGGGAIGKAGVEFDLDKLRATLNETMRTSKIEVDGQECQQILSINYGFVDYVDWSTHRLNLDRLPNPIRYTYVKDLKYREENEVRISLSALGVWHFVMDDGREITFPPFLRLPFDFRAAITSGAIKRIIIPDDATTLETELRRLIP